MKEYNWREERKKYQPDFRKQEEPAQQQMPPSPPPPEKKTNKNVLYILAAIVVIAIAAFIFLRPSKAEVRNRESITIHQDTNTVTIRQDTTATVQPQTNGLNITVPSISTKKSFEEIAEEKKHAVGLVAIYVELDDKLIEKVPAGTAWAFSPTQFATNGHVVNGFFETRNVKIANLALAQALQDTKVQNLTELVQQFGHAKALEIITSYIPGIIRRTNFSARILINQQAMKSCQITGVQIHPDYKNAESPDVAVMTVREPHRHYFRLASKEKLYNLKPGRPIALLGFPVENLAKGNVHLDSPVATFQSASIIALTDFDLKQTIPENRHWLRHSIPVTGGASGSAIFDQDGEVIALMNSGNMLRNFQGARVPNAALVNGGIRVDLLEGVGRKVPIESWCNRGVSPRELLEAEIKKIK